MLTQCIKLPFGKEFLEISVPSFILAPCEYEKIPKTHEQLIEAFEPLRAQLSKISRLTVVVSDQTRKAGVTATLKALGDVIKPWSSHLTVRLVVAYGLHAKQGNDVSEALYSKEFLQLAQLVHHEGRNSATLCSLGELSTGHPFYVARDVAEADIRVLVGAIGFHYYAGFSGGRKALLPGVCDEASIVRNHLRVLDKRSPTGRALGCAPANLVGNPVSDEMFEAARLVEASAGPIFLANAMVSTGLAKTPSGTILDVAYGYEHEQSFRQGCERFLRRNSVKLADNAPFQAVIASAGGHPYDISLYQAHKAYDNAFRAVLPLIQRQPDSRPTIVFIAKCTEGLGHPRFAHWLAHETREKHFDALFAEYEIVGQTSLSVRDKAALTRTIVVTDLSKEVCSQIGWEKAHSVEHALQLAGQLAFAVMPNAAHVLPQS